MTQDERRVLQLLAENPAGCTDALLLAYGLGVQRLARRMRAVIKAANK
jgi:hypothetical protein